MSAGGGLRLVAGREFAERLRSRAFLIGNGLALLAVAAVVILPGLLGGGAEEAFELGAAGDEARSIADLAQTTLAGDDVLLDVSELEDAEQARTAVAEGELDGALVDDGTLLSDGLVPPAVEGALTAAITQHQLRAELEGSGVDSEQVAAALRDRGLVIEQVDPEQGVGDLVAVIVTSSVLFALVFAFGQWVAQGIVEEKQSRVVEVLLATTRPSVLLMGKVIGLGLLGLGMILALAGVGLGGGLLTGAITADADLVQGLLLATAWFLPGYVVFALLFAIAGAIVPRVEELQSSTIPVYLLLFLGIGALQAAVTHPDGAFAQVTALLPLTAPIVQPARVALGEGSVLETLVAFAGIVAFVAILVPLTTRIYAGGVLAVRSKVSLRGALRAQSR